MKGRTISLIVVLVLLNYLVLSTLWNLLGSSEPPLPTPTRTPLPTYTRAAAARAYVTATATERPAPTVTNTVEATATPTIAPTKTPAPTDTPAPTQPPATATVPAPTTAPSATTAAATATTAAATATPEVKPSPSPTINPNATSFIHTVVAGESLSLIAQKYGVSIDAIVEANGLKSANQVFIGQKLIIPAPAAKSTPAAGPTQRTHVVKAGDYLGAIAQKYGVSIDAIMKANKLTNADQIYIGQVLIIP